MTPREALRILLEGLRRRPHWIVILAAFAALGIWALLPSAKRSIREVVYRVESVLESLDVEPMETILSERFLSDDTGDRDETMAQLRRAFEDLISLHIKIEEIRVEMRGDQAAAMVYFRISGMMKGGGGVYNQVPFRGLRGDPRSAGAPERCRVRFAKESGRKWRITSAELLPPAAPEDNPHP